MLQSLTRVEYVESRKVSTCIRNECSQGKWHQTVVCSTSCALLLNRNAAECLLYFPRSFHFLVVCLLFLFFFGRCYCGCSHYMLHFVWHWRCLTINDIAHDVAAMCFVAHLSSAMGTQYTFSLCMRPCHSLGWLTIQLCGTASRAHISCLPYNMWRSFLFYFIYFRLLYSLFYRLYSKLMCQLLPSVRRFY